MHCHHLVSITQLLINLFLTLILGTHCHSNLTTAHELIVKLLNSYVLFAHKYTSQSITQSPSQPLPNTLVNQQLHDNLSNNFARQLSQHESISFVIERA